MTGRITRLLPHGYRGSECGKTYPLPSNAKDIQTLASIPIPPRSTGAAAIYLRRALKEFKKRQWKRQSAILDTSKRVDEIAQAHKDFENMAKRLEKEARQAVDGVKQAAEEQIASLKDLFELGRKGLEGQMKAHLAGEQWKNEEISARDFRDCFRMVSQAVKGLGLPSDQRKRASEAVMEEVAASISDTKSALSMAPGADPEVKH